jgi:hypothetical protein
MASAFFANESQLITNADVRLHQPAVRLWIGRGGSAGMRQVGRRPLVRPSRVMRVGHGVLPRLHGLMHQAEQLDAEHGIPAEPDSHRVRPASATGGVRSRDRGPPQG